jgi:hypothetical protein
MKTNTISSVALILSLLLVLSTSTSIVSAYSSATNPICANSGVLSIETADLQTGGAAGINFDYAANYYDADGDSAPLLVRKGDGASTGWKFISYSDNTLATVQ